MKRRTRKKNSGMEKIAASAGVSIATVSRVFNDHPYVKEDMRKKILRVALEAGYTPKIPLGQKTIGVISGELGPFESLMLNALIKELSRRELSHEIIYYKNIELIEERFLRAAIILVYEEKYNFRERFPHTQFICVNGHWPDYPRISFDHAEGIELAVDYLVERGHSKIALMLNKGNSWGDFRRCKGYEAALKKHALHLDPELLVQGFPSNILEDTAKLLLKNPDAVIVTPEPKGLPFSHALNLLGKKVPEDISVISFEIPYVSPYIWPPHTTVSQDFEKLVKKTVDLAKHALDSKNKIEPVDIMVKNKIIERDSVRNFKTEPEK